MAIAMFASPAAATVSIAGLDFDDNAFVDAVDGSTGSNLVGPDITTWLNFDTESVQISFTDNVAVNGPGADIAVFTAWLDTIFLSQQVDQSGDPIAPFVQADPIDTGLKTGGTSGPPLGLLEVDLTDLGVPPGAAVSTLMLGAPDTASIAAVGALHSRAAGSVRAPAATPFALILLVVALAAFGCRRLRYV